MKTGNFFFSVHGIAKEVLIKINYPKNLKIYSKTSSKYTSNEKARMQKKIYICWTCEIKRD